jgi:Spy/CpxP family protein refolding chaperone
MNRPKRLFRWSAVPLALGLLALTLGLTGCFRGGWHGPYDPARFEERLNHIQEEIAEELEIEPHQEEAFNALMADYRQLARQWREGWNQAAVDARPAVEREPADAFAVGELLKQRVRARPDNAALEALIDKSVAFFNTLEPAQQEEVRARLLRHLRRHT